MNFLYFVLVFMSVSYTLELWLNLRQRKLLHLKEMPKDVLERHKELRELIDPSNFSKSQEYGRAKNLFSIVVESIGFIQNFALLIYGFYPFSWNISGKWLSSFSSSGNTTDNETLSLNQDEPKAPSEYLQSFVFFGFTTVVSFVLSMPEDLYGTFVLEERFGFNKKTWKIYITDILKTALIGVVLGVPIISGFIAIVRYTGSLFAIYLWIFTTVLSVLLVIIYPIVLLPLFNKLTPLPDGSLRDKLSALSQKVGFSFSQVLVMDGSKRSGHSNAFFTGFGAQRKIVLYDTLIEQMNEDEICAVLAHELGHWTYSHIYKSFALMTVHNLLSFIIFSKFIDSEKLFADFGFNLPAGQHPVVIGLSLFMLVYEPIDSVFSFLLNGLMRRFEYQADAFATNLGLDLSVALVKLHRENSSTLIIDPLYSAYHYDHPTLIERLTAIDAIKDGYASDAQMKFKSN